MEEIKIPKGSQIIVTGGSGFIGSHWVDYLINHGMRVTIIDNLATGNIQNVNKKAKYFLTDTTDYNTLQNLFKLTNPTLVYDLAANTNVPLSIKRPLYDFKNLRGSLNIIHLSKKLNVKKIIFLSTGFIYGNTAKRPITEMAPYKVLSPYGITKKCVEDYLQFYKNVYKLDYTILRPATIYGPRQIYGAMADYINKLAKNSQAEIFGDGSKTRDYVFIEDFIDALVKATNLENYDDPIFNIGTGKETTLKKLYFTIAKILGKKAEPIYEPDRPGELEYYSCSYAKFHKATHWSPHTNLKEGLTKTIKWWGYKTL